MSLPVLRSLTFGGVILPSQEVALARHWFQALRIRPQDPAGLAALVLTGRLNSAQPTAGTGFELDAIAAAVVGGTSLAGGRGTAWGTFLGLTLLPMP
uniref:Uncharacterized protein n=1 Tax=Thermus islandicus TaxID=540988 RepID=A0A7C2C250_9DEIN